MDDYTSIPMCSCCGFEEIEDSVYSTEAPICHDCLELMPEYGMPNGE